jgi:predicted ATPase
MKLRTVTISNYKCIRRACTFEASDITCFVGKNESGKTAVLEALYRLNPIREGQGEFNVDDDYPRIDVEDYRLAVEKEGRDHALVTRATFMMEEEDRELLEKDFPGALTGPEIVLSKGYENRLQVELEIDEKRLVSGLLAGSGLSSQQMKQLSRCSTIEELSRSMASIQGGVQTGKLADSVREAGERGVSAFLFERCLANRVPRFLYFDEFYQMEGHVNVQSLIQRQQQQKLLDSDYPLLGIIDLARLDLEEISSPRRALERGNRLEGASNHLTRRIMKYWSQNRDLEMRFDIRPGLPDDPPGMQTGTNLWCSVYNAKQKVSTLLGRRSRGFVWFFSFLAWFSMQRRKNIPLILLLDEPSLFLHATAQRDLLRFLEDECEAGLQVIYTTQSPYLIDSERFDRVRILEDRSTDSGDEAVSPGDGTQVYIDPLLVHRESILPLEGAMVHQIARDLFPGSNLLLVEGVHDLIYLQIMSALLSEGGRQGLDPAWVITPMGGAHRLPLFTSLMGSGADRHCACLFNRRLDGEGLATGILRSRAMFTYADFTKSSVAEVEDLFDQDFYLYLVNSAYLEMMTKPVPKSSLKKSKSMVHLVREYFQSVPEGGRVGFSRFKPAKFFIEHGPALKSQISAETYGRFERLFRAVNEARGREGDG